MPTPQPRLDEPEAPPSVASEISRLPAWVSAPRAARLLGVSRRTLSRMLAAGEVPYRKRGTQQQARVVVHRDVLARLLDAGNAA